jgi:hypothetical protein
MRCLSIIFCLWLSSPFSAVAEVYRWVDADGQVHYGERPPPQGARRIELPATTESDLEPDREAADRRARQQRLLDAYEYERERKEAAAAEAARSRQADAARCADLQQRWRRLSFGGPVYYRRADGDRDYLSDEQREAAKERLRPAYRAACGELPR